MRRGLVALDMPQEGADRRGGSVLRLVKAVQANEGVAEAVDPDEDPEGAARKLRLADRPIRRNPCGIRLVLANEGCRQGLVNPGQQIMQLG